MNSRINQQKVIDYYHTFESRLGYSLILKGIRHFGYYPPGQEKLSMYQAQLKMEEYLAEKLDLPIGSKVLDAGCGEGHVAIHLARKYGYRMTGIDFIDNSIKIARKKAEKAKMGPAVNFIQGDYTRYNFPENHFDAIYTMETLVHVANYKKALGKFRKFLKPKGLLVLFEYTITSSKKQTPAQKRLWQEIKTGTGMFGLDKFYHGCFPKLLKEADFTSIKVEEITPRINPMLETLYRLTVIPFSILKLLKLEKNFVNAMCATVGFRDMKANGSWRYIIATTRKPG
ncbi:MAG: An16g00300, 2-heptaprenyl-1,4-naphthoquinone methyltransferase [Candidatus Gottesmanbacteria bacterium GW2011_GWA2_43_14]|uniref:An16g00300, 2-heptaprenyl-1,4-naphthoquinone methyltransferase n=1 Tax=Candidatus Gottesmanbacteria bacterium GW2011_GWA2_43_14 TaxID=1618443 RepID=A0A0G1FLZ8_9BACT|nr:MAG: An16g00300, 2-heptaprenyl-1,4-naphthoquinone methyltransferase [Candidatus Gottesmanbacteria bacterium GW2011_GWA2_43_14]